MKTSPGLVAAFEFVNRAFTAFGLAVAGSAAAEADYKLSLRSAAICYQHMETGDCSQCSRLAISGGGMRGMAELRRLSYGRDEAPARLWSPFSDVAP